MDEILDAEYKVGIKSRATRTHIFGRAKLNLQTLVAINEFYLLILVGI